jgi:2-haloacid dehalogenase
MNELADRIKVIAFDVFGTVVDWHGSVSRELAAMNLGVDPDQFALAWRAGYKPAMAEVMERGEWVILDDLHRRILDKVLHDFALDSLAEAERQQLNLVWHLLTEMAKHASLPWDCILSAENFNKYKPHPDAYLGVVRTFAAEPDQVMLAAAHHSDLESARKCGLETAYIERPFEYGRAEPKSVAPWSANTLHSSSILHLADLLGC